MLFSALLQRTAAQGACDLAMALGYTTGHGDSTESVIEECRRTQDERVEAARREEREACAGLIETEFCGCCWCDEITATKRARSTETTP